MRRKNVDGHDDVLVIGSGGPGDAEIADVTEGCLALLALSFALSDKSRRSDN